MHHSPIARLLWCGLGAATGIGLALLLTSPPASPFFLASLGGSAVFLFGLTRAPAAQPRALFGGHLGGAFIGIVCYQFFGDALWVYVLAQVLVLWYMLLTGTVHPPAGANPIIRGKTSSCVTSRHFDYGKSRRVFISRSNRPYGLICSHTNGVNAA